MRSRNPTDQQAGLPRTVQSLARRGADVASKGSVDDERRQCDRSAPAAANRRRRSADQVKRSLISGEDDILGNDFIVEVTAGKGADKVRQVTRIAAENPTKRIAVYAPHPLFNPIARASLEAISNRAGSVRVFDELAPPIEWVGE